jgi:hypothetical protein
MRIVTQIDTHTHTHTHTHFFYRIPFHFIHISFQSCYHILSHLLLSFISFIVIYIPDSGCSNVILSGNNSEEE